MPHATDNEAVPVVVWPKAKAQLKPKMFFLLLFISVSLSLSRLLYAPLAPLSFLVSLLSFVFFFS